MRGSPGRPPIGNHGAMGKQALLVMDVQNGVVERYLAGAADGLLDALGRATAAARAAGVPVIYVRAAFRPGAPEVSRRNKAFSAVATRGGMGADDRSTFVNEAIGPEAGDIVVVKKRISAFIGSDLDVVLRSLDVDALVLSGIATSGVVLSTLRYAADMDFELTVLRDGCADADPEVHRVLLEKVFPRQAAVVSVGEWVGGLKPADR
jgi:nicotinamidase-related amidase